MRVLSSFAAVAVAAGCAASYAAPTGSDPTPGYVPVDATADEAWEGVLDVIADFGIQVDFIDADMRLARTRGMIARGAWTRLPANRPQRGLVPASRINEDAMRWADCGELDGEGVTGWVDLYADIAIRVREHQGRGIVKVVAPEMWVLVVDGERAQCVSTGVFEEEMVSLVESRVTPIFR